MSARLICMRIEAGVRPTPGSTKTSCDLCAHPVWISESGREFAATDEVEKVCWQCSGATPEMARNPRPDQIVPGAIEELERMRQQDLRTAFRGLFSQN